MCNLCEILRERDPGNLEKTFEGQSKVIIASIHVTSFEGWIDKYKEEVDLCTLFRCIRKSFHAASRKEISIVDAQATIIGDQQAFSGFAEEVEYACEGVR